MGAVCVATYEADAADCQAFALLGSLRKMPLWRMCTRLSHPRDDVLSDS